MTRLRDLCGGVAAAAMLLMLLPAAQPFALAVGIVAAAAWLATSIFARRLDERAKPQRRVDKSNYQAERGRLHLNQAMDTAARQVAAWEKPEVGGAALAAAPSQAAPTPSWQQLGQHYRHSVVGSLGRVNASILCSLHGLSTRVLPKAVATPAPATPTSAAAGSSRQLLGASATRVQVSPQIGQA